MRSSGGRERIDPGEDLRGIELLPAGVGLDRASLRLGDDPVGHDGEREQVGLRARRLLAQRRLEPPAPEQLANGRVQISQVADPAPGEDRGEREEAVACLDGAEPRIVGAGHRRISLDLMRSNVPDPDHPAPPEGARSAPTVRTQVSCPAGRTGPGFA